MDLDNPDGIFAPKPDITDEESDEGAHNVNAVQEEDDGNNDQKKKKKANRSGSKKSDATHSRGKTNAAAPDIFSVGRNAPCPCGSGERFKNCCGKVQ
jgi:uncharacterized protein YecA (UPF0149 family)